MKEKANSLKILKLPNYWLDRKGWLSLENWNKVRKKSIKILQNFQQLKELQISSYVSIISRKLFNCDMLSIVLSKLLNLKNLIVISSEYGLSDMDWVEEDVNRDTFCIKCNFEHLEYLELRFEQVPLSRRLINDICIHCQNLTTFVINGANNIKNKELKRWLAPPIYKHLNKLCCFEIKNCRNISTEYFEETFPVIGIFEK